jgi:protein-tyrosine phosphatase
MTESGTEQPKVRILFLCHGNICRSTMAEYVMDYLVQKAGLEDGFMVDSAATSREEIGNDIHPGTRQVLEEHGIPCGHHASRQMGPADYARFDYLIGMDQKNLAGIYRLLLGEEGMGYSWRPVSEKDIERADPDGKVSLLLSWAGLSRDVADPWYTGNFDATYRDVMLGCTKLLEALASKKP